MHLITAVAEDQRKGSPTVNYTQGRVAEVSASRAVTSGVLEVIA